jgi:hypothetical protein
MSFQEPQVALKLDGSRRQGSGKYLKNLTEQDISSRKNTTKSTRGLQETYIAIAHMRIQ